MTRLALVLFAALAPTSALACGMYVPPERERLLAEIFDEIDNTVAEVDAATIGILPAEAETAPTTVPEVSQVEVAPQAAPVPSAAPAS
jgi:hypothetical protein